MAKKRKTTKKKTKKKTTARKTSPRGGLSAASIADLRHEIDRRQKAIGKLETKRDALAAQLAAVDAEIGEIRSLAGGGGARRGRTVVAKRGGARKRPRNAMNLVEALSKVLAGVTMSVTEVAGAVQKAGYRTTSANFRTIVNQALISNPSVFKKVERGRYTAK
ncbi:MAG: hypothetical protein KDA25_09095 [Phycisphaerales bacterium]|nr:hypothetical protein [Phycisphaerales bacterium]